MGTERVIVGPGGIRVLDAGPPGPRGPRGLQGPKGDPGDPGEPGTGGSDDSTALIVNAVVTEPLWDWMSALFELAPVGYKMAFVHQADPTHNRIFTLNGTDSPPSVEYGDIKTLFTRAVIRSDDLSVEMPGVVALVPSGDSGPPDWAIVGVSNTAGMNYQAGSISEWNQLGIYPGSSHGLSSFLDGLSLYLSTHKIRTRVFPTSGFADDGIVTDGGPYSALTAGHRFVFPDGAVPDIYFYGLDPGQFIETTIKIANGLAGSGGTIAPTWDGVSIPRVNSIPVDSSRTFHVTIWNDAGTTKMFWDLGVTSESTDPDY